MLMSKGKTLAASSRNYKRRAESGSELRHFRLRCSKDEAKKINAAKQQRNQSTRMSR
jgi:hypothetical protein